MDPPFIHTARLRNMNPGPKPKEQLYWKVQEGSNIQEAASQRSQRPHPERPEDQTFELPPNL